MRKANLEKSLVLYMIEVYFHDEIKEKEEVIKYVQATNPCNDKLYGKIMFKLYKVKIIRFAIDTVLAHVAEISGQFSKLQAAKTAMEAQNMRKLRSIP